MADLDLELEIAIAAAKAKDGARTGMTSTQIRNMIRGREPSPEEVNLEQRRRAIRDAVRGDVTIGEMAGLAGNALALGHGDNVMAVMSAAAGLQPDEQGGARFFDFARPFPERYDTALGAIREDISRVRQENPGLSLLAEVGGAALNPLDRAKSFAGAVGRGALTGGIFAAGEADEEETLSGRLAHGAEGAVMGGAMAAATRPLFSAVFGKRPPKTTTRTLRTAERRAYDKVEKSGFTFSKQELDDVVERSWQRLNAPDSGYVKGDRQVEAAMAVLEKNRGGKTLAQVDNVRKRLWDRWKSGNDSEKRAIRMVIEEIDNLMGGDETTPLLQAAREAHKLRRRTEIIDEALDRADLQRASAHSGGNLNAYRQAIRRILDSPEKLAWFPEDQQQMLRAFLDNDEGSRILRSVSKLSPDGSGLMLAFTIGAGAFEPSLLLGTGAGVVAKNVEERQLMQDLAALRNMASGGGIPGASAIPGAAASGVGIVGAEERAFGPR